MNNYGLVNSSTGDFIPASQVYIQMEPPSKLQQIISTLADLVTITSLFR